MIDPIGDEFKKLERQFETILPYQRPVILRLDGKAFHTVTKRGNFEKPFDDHIHQTMVEVSSVLCKEIQNARFAYTQSDEISILIYERRQEQTPWFGNRVQKICSVSASLASTIFTENVKNKLNGQRAIFDARVFSIERSEVPKYFIWRQEDAIKNSISSLAQSNFQHKALHKKNRQEMLEMLGNKGVIWEDLEEWKQRGSAITKQFIQKQCPNGLVDRSYWGSCPGPHFDTSFFASFLKQEE